MVVGVVPPEGRQPEAPLEMRAAHSTPVAGPAEEQRLAVSTQPSPSHSQSELAPQSPLPPLARSAQPPHTLGPSLSLVTLSSLLSPLPHRIAHRDPFRHHPPLATYTSTAMEGEWHTMHVQCLHAPSFLISSPSSTGAAAARPCDSPMISKEVGPAPH